MLWHVWQRVHRCQRIGAVYIVTDSEELLAVVRGWGGAALVTSRHCSSGTDRIASVVSELPGDFIINVQADEPLLDPAVLDALIDAWRATGADLITPVCRLVRVEELEDHNVVKVARGVTGDAIYFSRSPIPAVRGVPLSRWLERHQFWRHVGVYGYRREVLARYRQLPRSDLETVESLEQLRWIDAGYRIATVEVSHQPMAVDSADDLVRLALEAEIVR